MPIQQFQYGFYPMTSGYYDTADQLRQYQLNMAHHYEKINEENKSRLLTPAAFEAARREKKQKFAAAIGGLDFERTPLNPVCTGQFDYEGFTVKNLYFESQPRFYVTANLYIPHGLGPGKHAAVLMTCGHSDVGKAAPRYRRAAMDMANNGLIVLLIDPIGQGERVQYEETDKNGHPLLAGCTIQHTYLGEPLEFAGASLARYMVWDLIRAVDFLESLDIVDANRIGMTGLSGGGTQTAYMMLLEDRLAAAMPCCYITSRCEHMKSGNLHDLEQNIWNVIPDEIDYDDLITGMAPKPVRLGLASYDFFGIEGAMKSYDRAQKVYNLYEKVENLSLTITDATHSMNHEMRMGIVNFFRRHLLGLDETVTESMLDDFDARRLQVTPSGSVLRDLPGARHLFELTQEYFARVRYTPVKDSAELRDRVLDVLNLPPLTHDRPAIRWPRIITDDTADGIRYRRIFFFTEKDTVCTGVLLQPENMEPQHCTVYISEDSTEKIFENRSDIESLLADGSVFVFDPRGTGAVKSRPLSPDRAPTAFGPVFSNDYRSNGNLCMLGSSLYALRSYDAVRAYDLMAGDARFGFTDVTLAGRGLGAVYALTAAAIVSVKPTVFGEIIRYEDLFDEKFHACDPSQIVHGLLCQYDIPLLADMMEAERR